MRIFPSDHFRGCVALVALLFLGCLPAGLSSGPRVSPADTARPGADLLIENVTVIDSANGMRENRSVYVDQGKISAIFPAGASAAAGAFARPVAEAGPVARKRIDGTGLYLIPGLWDMHVHVTYLPELTDAMSSLFLDYGVTSVRDTGGLVRKMQPVIEAWREPGAAAPRIYWSGPLLDGRHVVYDGHDRPEIGITNPTPAAAHAQVEALKEAGVDFIKIYELVTPDVFAALVETARAYALPIAAHIPLSMTADSAGPRVDSMEHLRNVDLACSAETNVLQERRLEILSNEANQRTGHALRSHIHRQQRTRALATLNVDDQQCRHVIASLRQTIQVPTLRLNTISLFSPLSRTDWKQALMQLPTGTADQWRATAKERLSEPDPLNQKMAKWSLDLVSAMQAAEVPIGAGTDTPIGQAIPGYSLHTELERLVSAGLTPLEAIGAATLRPAEFFGREAQTGQIAVGMDADLVLLAADPLQEITNTRRVETVILRGEIVRGGR